jgi:wobble nucleotide-excising tRNase
MMKNIRVLKGAAVLADRSGASPCLDLKRFNLVYGFNGSGKSTLSRIFAALEHGKEQAGLPDGCTFEIEMVDGQKYSYPSNLAGLEKRVCVFNKDFIAANLHWETGEANPVFYIGVDQADSAAKMKPIEDALPAARALHDGETRVLTEREKAFTGFKKGMARNVSERLRQPSRYEAPQFVADIEKLGATTGDKLSDVDLDAATATCARSEPPAKVQPVEIPIDTMVEMIHAAFDLGPKTIGTIMVEDLTDHPQMVSWAKLGHEYHLGHDLDTCLYCANKISAERKQVLTDAFDDKFTQFVTELTTATHHAGQCLESLAVAKAAIPRAAQLSAEFQPPFETAAANLYAALDDVSPLLSSALDALKARKAAPTTAIAVTLPPVSEVETRLRVLEQACSTVSGICDQHSAMVDDFIGHQKKARESIRRHFAAENAKAYSDHTDLIAEAKASEASAKARIGQLETELADLRSKIQQHGPAAEKINALIKSYLGHGELSIVAVAEGYELHRHGALVAGEPSEGEKTAIALCYFLSSLEAENRKIKDLIVVVDDPVSSLDTKAMNYACALVRNRLGDAAQVIVLTHNHHCLNELKKFWKGLARAKQPTATLKFIDVAIPTGAYLRSATIIELPKHLREYESEYHYLFEKVMSFEAAGAGHFDYAFMMPNVLRRVLEIFLAFKIPSNGNISDKLKMLCSRHADLDQYRLNALERLSQVESHSDNLDDLISQSSMTIEESRDACASLMHLMEIVDGDHHTDLKNYCQV